MKFKETFFLWVITYSAANFENSVGPQTQTRVSVELFLVDKGGSNR